MQYLTSISPSRCRSKNFVGRTAACLVIGLFSLDTALKAQTTAYTAPLGIYTVQVPGTLLPSAPVRTYLGIQLLPSPQFVGRVVSVSGNTVSIDQYSAHTGFSTPDRKSYLQVLEGSGSGFIVDIDEFRVSDMVCAEDLTSWMQPYTLVLIRPHSSLSDILGEDNSFGLAAGQDADVADNVVIWDPDAQEERVYYFHSTRSRWEEQGIEADASSAVFRFPYGFYIVRRSPGTLRIVLSGGVGSEGSGYGGYRLLLPVRPGANVFSLPINLSGSLDAIVRTDGAFPIISGRNARRSDILTFEEPTTGLRRGPFYHLTRPNTSGWREIGVNDSTASIEPLDFLSTLTLWRNGEAGRVLVEGSLEPPAGPQPPPPSYPEPNESSLTINYPFPGPLPPDLTVRVEISRDLQNWSAYHTQMTDGGGLQFLLPADQTRLFYRLAISFGEF